MVLRPSAMKAAAEQAKAAGGGAPGRGRAARRRSAGRRRDRHGGRHRRQGCGAQAGSGRPGACGSPPRQRLQRQRRRPPAAAPKPGGQPLGAIQLLSGANAGKELELTKPLTTLGKPGVQVAVLTRRPQGYFITHVEGANRPDVNGQQIGAAPHALKDHDVIELAGVKMEFFLKA